MAKRKKVSHYDPAFVKMDGIKVYKSNIDDVTNKPNGKTEVEMKLGQKIGYNLEEKKCKVELALALSLLQADKKTIASASFEAAFHFQVSNMDDLLDSSPESIEIDPSLPAHLVEMSYSTLRGIAFERLAGTQFRNFVLPVINPYEVLKEK